LTRQSTSRSITADPLTATARLPLLRGGRPLKRWRYVAVFCDELMACAATVQVGPAKQAFWAIHTRADGAMRERTRSLRSRGAVELAAGRVRVRDSGVELDLELAEDAGWEARCDDPGGGEVWTRKQAGVAARGSLRVDGGPARALDARAIIDDTAGYHARHTEWYWSAGVGHAPGGDPLAWNLVSGVNDPATGSERAVWVDRVAREAPPVEFDADLSSVSCEDGSELRFRPEAERARTENLLLVKSDYRAPFGTFSGTLPGGVELARGLGVVEHHRALW
jgi:Protein of unknown function (DUF2804)